MTHSPAADQQVTEETLYDRLGGEAAVGAVVEIFYGKVLADEALAGYFDGVDVDRLKRHQSRFIGQALGAVRPYSGRSMEKAHGHLGVTDAAFDRVVGHLAASLAEAGVDEDTIGVIAARLGPLRADIVTA
ncbi:group I truncated hemoglobin [Streptomyces millisiae]|uniref:Group 1 truncated hemoglobin n=1 Tax=Streptomyces millisiae TaxID=3075542 RepID=A0ABU2LX97_9ACTN|nr:group 1 truncated hemoglobin [Streptomyces sp. DSM 44918]MDT0322225.1 group 1 truncated hemoglobin [Streptomyces sp. DSM 44918]